MSDPALWIALAAALLGSFFAACHVALKTFSRTRLADLLAERDRLASMPILLARRQQLLLMTGTIRTCLSLTVLLGLLLFVERQLFHDPALGQWQLPLQYVTAFFAAGLVLSIFVVSIPESLARYSPEKLIARSMAFLFLCRTLFQPVTSFLHLFDPIVRRISGYSEDEKADDELTDEVLSVVEDRDESGHVDQTQKEMLEAVVEFGQIEADHVMTPRTDIKGVEVNASLDELRQTIMECGHSRLPVFEESLDNILGILYAKDLIRFLGPTGDDTTGFTIREIMREAVMVPETKSVRDLLAEFRAEQVHIAIVLDEYGGTAGLVTIEDIVEEIIGDIQDEYERPEPDEQVKRIDDRTVEVDARAYVDDLNDLIDLDLPEDDDYDTVGGFVFATLGHVPREGESFEFERIRVTVLNAERNRVSRVRIEILEEAVQVNGNGNGHG